MTDAAKTAHHEPATQWHELAESSAAAAPESSDWVAPLPQPELASLSIEDLLWRMRGGDRSAAAEFLNRYGSRIRRRIRGKLGSSIRRLFDSMDILSTIGRRLDLYVMAGRMHAADESQLWSLLFRMADHALVDKARQMRLVNVIESNRSDFTHEQSQRRAEIEFSRASSADVEMDTYLSWIDDPTDREVFSLWLMGENYAEIGRRLKLDEAAARRRFRRVQLLLQQRLQAARL